MEEYVRANPGLGSCGGVAGFGDGNGDGNGDGAWLGTTSSILRRYHYITVVSEGLGSYNEAWHARAFPVLVIISPYERQSSRQYEINSTHL